MFVKVTKSGPRRYVKLVESFRDEAGKSRQRVIATLGRLEAVTAGESSALINGLLRVTGQPTLDEGTGEIDFAPARSVGDTWLLTSLWKDLGLDDAFRRVLRSKRQFDAERLLQVMVFNRLCDPESKLGVLRWLEDVLLPDVDTASISHQHLLRTMDTLSDCSEALNDVLAQQLKPLIDKELSIVFYDLTTIRVESSTSLDGDVRHYGPLKEGGIGRSWRTDRKSPRRRRPHAIRRSRPCRRMRQWFEKLDHQDAGHRYRGRKLSDAGMTARFYKAVTDAHLGHILKVDLTAETFNYVLDQRALDRARMLDGKLLLVTNMVDHDPQEVVDRYRSLADIERGFRVLKSDIEIAPVYHRLPDRIRAHALICFPALVLYRVLRMRLKASNHPLSPTRALEIAARSSSIRSCFTVVRRRAA